MAPDLPRTTTYAFGRTMSFGASCVASCVPTLLLTVYGRTGILTRCASLTPFGLNLAPGSPHADEPAVGTLSLSVHWILTNVFAT